jgi:hypothetical protein
MIIKAEPTLNQDNQDIQPPPPEYTETLPKPGPTSPQRPAPAAQPQYPPQPSPNTQDNLTPQQREARIGQEYRNRRKRPLYMSSLNSLTFPSSAGPVRERPTRCYDDIRVMRYRLCRLAVSNRFGMSVVSLENLFAFPFHC